MSDQPRRPVGPGPSAPPSNPTNTGSGGRPSRLPAPLVLPWVLLRDNNGSEWRVNVALIERYTDTGDGCLVWVHGCPLTFNGTADELDVKLGRYQKPDPQPTGQLLVPADTPAHELPLLCGIRFQLLDYMPRDGRVFPLAYAEALVGQAPKLCAGYWDQKSDAYFKIDPWQGAGRASRLPPMEWKRWRWFDPEPALTVLWDQAAKGKL